MTRRLRPLLPDELDDAQRALVAALHARPRPVERAADGSLLGPFDPMLRAPRTGVALQAVGAALRYQGVLSDRIRELATIIVAAHHRASFEWWAHAPLAVAAGVPEALVDAVRTGGAVEPEDAAERAAVVATQQMLATGDLDDTAWAAAVEHLGESGAVELIMLVGQYSHLGLLMRVVRVPLPDSAAPVDFPA